MRCRNCGCDFDNGFLCPRCGTKIGEKELVGQIIQESDAGEEKIPWYLSMWFIILISACTFGILWIPATIFGLIRFFKYKKRRVGVAFLDIVLLAPCIIVIIVMIMDAQKEGQLNRFIEAGKYSEAQKYIEQEYDEGDYSYTNALALLYEAQGLYDEAACLWLEYYRENYSLLELSDSAISKLNKYIENHGEELREESIGQIQALIADKERVEAEAQAAKEAKAAQEQAEREAKAAQEQAEREAKAAQEQAEKEEKAQERTETGKQTAEEQIVKKEDAINDNEGAEKRNKSSEKTGHIACEQFNTESESVLANQIFSDYAEYENINLIEFIGNDGPYDRVRAIMSHYDENGLVGIERTYELTYSGTNHYFRNLYLDFVKEDKLDLSGLEGKSISISGNYSYERAAIALFGIYDYLGVEEVSGTITFHDMDRVRSDLDKQQPMVINYIYSKKPVVRVEAIIDGKNFEGDFCLGYSNEWPQYNTEYKWLEDEGWRLDIVLDNDKGEGLLPIEIDLKNMK